MFLDYVNKDGKSQSLGEDGTEVGVLGPRRKRWKRYRERAFWPGFGERSMRYTGLWALTVCSLCRQQRLRRMRQAILRPAIELSG